MCHFIYMNIVCADDASEQSCTCTCTVYILYKYLKNIDIKQMKNIAKYSVTFLDVDDIKFVDSSNTLAFSSGVYRSLFANDKEQKALKSKRRL